jgi:hypothetical protein
VYSRRSPNRPHQKVKKKNDKYLTKKLAPPWLKQYLALTQKWFSYTLSDFSGLPKPLIHMLANTFLLILPKECKNDKFAST